MKADIEVRQYRDRSRALFGAAMTVWGWIAVAMLLGVSCMGIGIFSDHRDMNSGKPFAFYFAGLAWFAVAIVLMVIEGMGAD
jgi:hypothetical protein